MLSVVVRPGRPVGSGDSRVRVVADGRRGNVDPLALVTVERLADGGVVVPGVVRDHVPAGVTGELLHDVLRDAAVDEPGFPGCGETGGRARCAAGRPRLAS